jgi:hypothetical protein
MLDERLDGKKGPFVRGLAPLPAQIIDLRLGFVELLRPQALAKLSA